MTVLPGFAEPMCGRSALDERSRHLRTPARCSFRISAVLKAAVTGRPGRLLFCRTWARPARVRSRRISLSNAANIASRPAMARPAGVVRSSASVSEMNPTPRCSTPGVSPADPLQTGPSDPDATPGGAAPEFTSRTCMAIIQSLPAADSRIARFCIARVCWSLWTHGHTAQHDTFSTAFVAGQKRCRILPSERPVWRAFRDVTRHPLLGHWAPNLRLATETGETRVPLLMQRSRVVLLDLAAPADAFLIRPDIYVAWVAGCIGTGHRR